MIGRLSKHRIVIGGFSMALALGMWIGCTMMERTHVQQPLSGACAAAMEDCILAAHRHRHRDGCDSCRRSSFARWARSKSGTKNGIRLDVDDNNYYHKTFRRKQQQQRKLLQQQQHDHQFMDWSLFGMAVLTGSLLLLVAAMTFLHPAVSRDHRQNDIRVILEIRSDSNNTSGEILPLRHNNQDCQQQRHYQPPPPPSNLTLPVVEARVLPPGEALAFAEPVDPYIPSNDVHQQPSNPAAAEVLPWWYIPDILEDASRETRVLPPGEAFAESVDPYIPSNDVHQQPSHPAAAEAVTVVEHIPDILEDTSAAAAA